MRRLDTREGVGARAALTLLLTVWMTTTGFGQDEGNRLSVPSGFRVERVADDPLAHDVFCMTLDAEDRVVVSGPGYVRALIDEDGDGQADRAEDLVQGLTSGAQGMFFDGTDLYCVAEGGVLCFRDRDLDGRLDTSAENVFPIRTGGEHHAHALRRGPDGWWYLLVGNDTGVSVEHARGASLVQQPMAGALLRMPPDFSSCEVYADGFRNAYDFDFHALGDVFVYDSDGERDVSLPWYQPTRVFQVLGGSHAGWLSRSWKRPDYFCDMPPVVARLGRGSPTGVVAYRHRAFPEPYRQALFVADWTFGRVLALPLRLAEESAQWRCDEPIEFVSAVGHFGFAPTDLEIDRDGNLLISVGGRGTRGGVYRVRWVGQSAATIAAEKPLAAQLDLEDCLSTLQPLSSSSRAKAQEFAQRFGRSTLDAAIVDPALPLAWRMRAVELATEYFGGLDRATHRALADAPAALRARAAWSLGRSHPTWQSIELVDEYLTAEEAIVVRSATEALATLCRAIPLAADRDRFRQLAAHPSPIVRQLAMLLPESSHEQTVGQVERASVVLAEISTLRRRVTRRSTWDPELLDRATELWSIELSPALRLELLRVIQLALGDMGPREGRAPVYDGYASRAVLPIDDPAVRRFARTLPRWIPSGDATLDYELARTASIVEADDPQLMQHLLLPLSANVHPSDQLHFLIAASRVQAPLNDVQRASVADALVSLESKLEQLGLRSDRNWQPRLTELCRAWLEREPRMKEAVLNAKPFGHPDHVRFLPLFSDEQRQQARQRFAERVADDPEYPLSPELVRELFASGDAQVEQLITTRAEHGEVRETLVRLVAKRAQAADRPLILEGLNSRDVEVVAECLGGLERLPSDESAEQLAALIRVLATSEREEAWYALRDRAARLLHRATGEQHGFVFGKEGFGPQVDSIQRWVEWMDERHPEYAGKLVRPAADPAALLARFSLVPWDSGDAQRGRGVFQRAGCAACHTGSTALGPDLAGVMRRFSREDLLVAIVDPNRDVSSRYVTTVIETVDGHVHTGAVIYDSVDGITLLTAQQETIRVEAAELVGRSTASVSLMPAGLLADAHPQEIADLIAYLETLR